MKSVFALAVCFLFCFFRVIRSANGNSNFFITMADLAKEFSNNGINLTASNKSILYQQFAGPNIKASGSETNESSLLPSNQESNRPLSRSVLRNRPQPLEGPRAAEQRSAIADERNLTINIHEMCNAIYLCDWI